MCMDELLYIQGLFFFFFFFRKAGLMLSTKVDLRSLLALITDSSSSMKNLSFSSTLSRCESSLGDSVISLYSFDDCSTLWAFCVPAGLRRFMKYIFYSHFTNRGSLVSCPSSVVIVSGRSYLPDSPGFFMKFPQILIVSSFPRLALIAMNHFANVF